LLLLDEVQELAEMGRFLGDAVGGLHKLFDRSTGATLVLSFTTGTQATMRAILGDALFDRASDLLTLPALNEAEGVVFISDLIREWSLDPERAPFPFTPAAISEVVAATKRQSGDLTPRALIREFNRILRQADLDIEDGVADQIDSAYALANRGEQPI